MGRLPTQFAGKLITFRIPYTLPGELLVTNGAVGIQFPDATFLHNVEKPVEVHRMTVRITPFDNATPAAQLTPAFVGAIPSLMNILEKYVRIRVSDTSKNEFLTKNAQLVDGISPQNEKVWNWAEPYTMVRSEGFQIAVDNILANFPITVGNTTVTVGALRIEVTFEGFLIVIAPPSESR
jgi:hypothetical protein